jgi:tetratricopeptide (TPR) repeat protein
MAYNNLGIIYENIGNNQLGLEYKIKALDIRQKNLGEQHPDTISSYHNVGISYFNRGEFDTAKNLLRKGYDLANVVLVPKHPLLKKIERSLINVTEKMYSPGFRKPPLHPKKKKRK